MFGVWTLILPNTLINTGVGIIAFIIPLLFIGRIKFKAEFDIMFKVDPIIKPIPNYNDELYKNKRIGKKDWYLKPSDLNIGEKKLRIKE